MTRRLAAIDPGLPLGELPPTFVLPGLTAVVVSLNDRNGRARKQEIERELRQDNA